MVRSPGLDPTHQVNHTQEDPPPDPTTRELLQQILELRREHELIRKRVEEVHRRAEEANAEHAATRQESVEARRQMNETLRGQDALQRANGDLLQRIQTRDEHERGRGTKLIMPEEGYPIFALIMAEVVPQQFIIPKIPPFTGSSDLEAHLKAFNAQMLISGGSDAVRCKVFVGTLASTTLKWFNSLSRSSIVSFAIFARTFVERFAANRVKASKIVDLFDVRQGSDKTLIDYLNCFCDACTSISTPNEEILVDAFVKGLRANSFNESLVWTPALSVSEIRLWATTHRRKGCDEVKVTTRKVYHQQCENSGNVTFLRRHLHQTIR